MGWGHACPPEGEGHEEQGEPGDAPLPWPPARLNPAHITSTAGRAVSLVNKCPLLSPELHQATCCVCPYPTALISFVSLIASPGEICLLHSRRGGRSLLTIVPPTHPHVGAPVPGAQEGSRGDPLLTKTLPLTNTPMGHCEAPPKLGTPRLGQVLPTDEAWSCTGGSCLTKPPLGRTQG